MIFIHVSVFHCSSKVVFLILNYLSFVLHACNVSENTVYKVSERIFWGDSKKNATRLLSFTELGFYIVIHNIFSPYSSSSSSKSGTNALLRMSITCIPENRCPNWIQPISAGHLFIRLIKKWEDSLFCKREGCIKGVYWNTTFTCYQFHTFTGYSLQVKK